MGRALVGTFGSLSFADQVDTFASDLQQHFTHTDARVVANSFGSYLFLQAQATMPRFQGRVLLFSPIVGSAESPETQHIFVPSRSECLQAMVAAGLFPAARHCEIHVGAADWQSGPAQILALGQHAGITVNFVSGRGHTLGKDYVGGVLDRWLLGEGSD